MSKLTTLILLIGLSSCSTNTIVIYETSYIQGCVDGVTAIVAAMGKMPHAYRIDTLCMQMHIEMLELLDPEQEFKKLNEASAGQSI